MHRIRISPAAGPEARSQGHDWSGVPPGQKPLWGGAREILVLILFFVLLAVAAFEGGYIYRDREADELRKQVHQLDIKTRDINGRLVGVEAVIKKK